MDHIVGVRVSENSREAQILQFFSFFNKTIIPLALVGYLPFYIQRALME